MRQLRVTPAEAAPLQSDEGCDRHDYRLSLSAERKQRDSSNHFGRYHYLKDWSAHNKK
jgi:hypothetical protein